MACQSIRCEVESRFPQHWPRASIMSHIHNYSTPPQCSRTAFKVALCDPNINKGLDPLKFKTQQWKKAITLKPTDSHRRTNTAGQDSGQEQYKGHSFEDKMYNAWTKSIQYVYVKLEKPFLNGRRGLQQYTCLLHPALFVHAFEL